MAFLALLPRIPDASEIFLAVLSTLCLPCKGDTRDQAGKCMIRSPVPLGRAVPLTLLAGGILWAYLPVLAEMSRKWLEDPQYSHGYLVPVFSAYLLWRSRKEASSEEIRPEWLGCAPLLAGVVLRLAGAFYHVSWLEAVSLVPVLWGTALLLGGRRAFRQSWLAFAFLLFMIPLPYRAETLLSQPLRQFATWLSTYGLQTMGWPAFQEGNVIVLNEHRIGIVNACNGLGMLILFFALAAGVAILLQAPWMDRLVILASAIPIAILANVIRIVITALLYELAGRRWGDLVFHDLAGWLMMPLALGMLWLVLRLLSWVLVPVALNEPPILAISSLERRFQHAGG